MGILILDFPLNQSIRTEHAGRTKIPIAVGENCIYFLKYMGAGTNGGNPRVIKVDLKNQTTSVSNNFATEFGYSSGVNIFPFAVGRNRNGDLYMDCLLFDFAEAEGSRNLYLRRFTVDPADLTLGAGTQRTLTGAADLGSIWDFYRFVRFGETLIVTPLIKELGSDEDYVLKVDLHGMRYHTIEVDTTTNTWNYKRRWLCSIMVDRTTNTLYWLSKAYYWSPGSSAIVEILDFKNLTYVAHTTGYDSGCGDATALRLYRDSTDKVRYYHVGNSGAAATYTSHFGTFYVDNGSIYVEVERTIDGTYKDYSGGNTTPIPLGITSDNKIAWLLIGGNWCDNDSGTAFSEGFQLVTTDDTFGSPTKIVSATYDIADSDYRTGDERRCVFLWEDDWCYYAPNTIVSSSPNDNWKWGKLDLSGTGITITQDDPYGTIIVPKSGLVPTTLTLTVTKV